METIEVSNLKKNFKIHKKSPGFLTALVSLFRRQYESIKAVDGISFTIKQGELVGFIGPNGAGKTTTLKLLSGLLYPTEGNLSVLGKKPFDRKSEFLKSISLVMGQKNQLWWDLPAIDSFDLNKEIYELPEHMYRKNLNELTSLLEVEEYLRTPVRQLSLGQRMKMELIASLLHRPKVLFLDEPTIGLDVVMQEKIREFILKYNKKYGATVLLTSHYMNDVKKLCKRVIIINKGRIVFDGKLDKLIVKYAKYKIFSFTSKKKLPQEQLREFGKLISFDGYKAVMSVGISNTNSVAGYLLSRYAVEDLTIVDPDIEEIIRYIFRNK